MNTPGNGQAYRFQTATATATAGPALAETVRVPGTPEDREKDDIPAPVDSFVIADAQGTRLAEKGHPAFPEPPERPRRHWLRWLLIGGAAVAIVAAAVHWGVPMVREMLDTVSTDDAFVAGHITYVSPRVDGVVTEVLVDQNDRVEPGMLLVRLDRQPFEVALAQAEASVRESGANLIQARARVRSQLAGARASYYRRKNAQERLRQQIASLKARVAELRARESSRALADIDQKRLANLVARGSATQAELDTRNNTLKNADEQVKVAWAEIQEIRSALGLAPNYEDPLNVPPDLETSQSTVQTAVSDIASSLAELGIPFDPKEADQAKAFEDFLRPGGGKSAGEGLEAVIEQAPAVRVALAAVERADRQREDALLRLSWTEVRSEVAGYVQDRQVHPGNRVEPGQSLVSIRPSYVWISANYKETQIQDIRIGMPVDLHVDAYPDRVFRGRVAGFSPGTGLSQSLLPPENATGNYVKVTQRLPVRIELSGPIPEETPLFAGLSVVPHVRFKEAPTGPGAGQRLHAFGSRRPIDVGDGPAGSLRENRDPEAGAGPP